MTRSYFFVGGPLSGHSYLFDEPAPRYVQAAMPPPFSPIMSAGKLPPIPSGIETGTYERTAHSTTYSWTGTEQDRRRRIMGTYFENGLRHLGTAAAAEYVRRASTR